MNVGNVSLVELDLFIADINDMSNNINFLMSDAFTQIFDLVIQPQNPEVEKVEIPAGKIKRFYCMKRSLKNEGKELVDDLTCPICLKVYKNKSAVVKSEDCDHVFHYKCLKKWLEYKPSCPICRKTCVF